MQLYSHVGDMKTHSTKKNDDYRSNLNYELNITSCMGEHNYDVNQWLLHVLNDRSYHDYGGSDDVSDRYRYAYNNLDQGIEFYIEDLGVHFDSTRNCFDKAAKRYKQMSIDSNV